MVWKSTYIYIYPQLPPLHCVHGCKHERRQLLTSIDTLGASLVSQMVNGEGNGLAAAAADGKISQDKLDGKIIDVA